MIGAGQLRTGRPLRIGITMRIDLAPGHGEPRDALARGWSAFMSAVLPEAIWVPLPNSGSGCVDIASGLDLSGFILSGGNDIGEMPERDETETAILQYAVDRGLPVFGVCRGMQMITSFFGGTLTACPEDAHMRTCHPVYFVPEATLPGGPSSAVVNSYHGNGVSIEALPACLLLAATADGGWIEAVRHVSLPIAGVMWHPEREEEPTWTDARLIRNLFGLAGAFPSEFTR